MIGDASFAWVWLLGAIMVATFAGVFVASLFQWSPAAVKAGIPLAIGIGHGPLLLGILSVVALAAFPGQNHSLHAGVMFTPLVVLALLGVRRAQSIAPEPIIGHGSWWSRGLNTALLLLVLALVGTSLLLPLTRNDPLEYATVARALFQVRDIASYPLLAPAQDPSGFYGPWTHPPLYPALIYSMYLLQGHADAPGLMRAIGPWATLCAGLIVYAIARQGYRPHVRSPLAAALFLATPLVFQSTIAANIDPLPVLGISLLLGAILASAGGPLRDGMLHGLVLGLSLWTHSQAILFPFLSFAAIALRNGWTAPRRLVLHLTAMGSAAAVIAAWPYLRNFALFGSIVSDSPAVYMIADLDWAQYFRAFRGLDNWTDKIQYGVLKGWFEAENFSLMFWLMSAGIVFAWMRLRQSGIWVQIASGRLPVSDSASACASGIVLCYLGGAVLATVTGQDVMIRNSRYLLVLMPCVALLAAEGIAQLAEAAVGIKALRWLDVPPIARFRSPLVKLAALAMIAGQLAALVIYTWTPLGLSAEAVGKPEKELLHGWPPNGAIEYLRKQTAATALVLSLKPADMYYAERRMISYLDPRLIDFYGATDPLLGMSVLKSLDVSYVYMPDYFLPPYYNSTLSEILGRPDLSKLRHSSAGHQVFEIGASEDRVCAEGATLAPGSTTWVQEHQYVFVGWKPIARLVTARTTLSATEPSRTNSMIPFFSREIVTVIQSPRTPLPSHDACSRSDAADDPPEYQLALSLEGMGLIQVRIRQYDARGKQVAVNLFGEAILSAATPQRKILRRFWALADSTHFQIHVEHRGSSSIRITQTALHRVVRDGICSGPAAFRPNGTIRQPFDRGATLPTSSPRPQTVVANQIDDCTGLRLRLLATPATPGRLTTRLQ